MTSIKKLVFVVFGFIIPNLALAQVKYSNEFLSIGVGARGLSLGGAQSALVGDASAGFWNPAGLVKVKSNLQLFVMHNEYFGGIGKYDYASFAAPIDATRTIGASFIRFAIDDIIDSTDLIDKDGNIDYDRLKTFSSADYAFLFSYAQTLKVKGLSAGGNVKVIHRKVGDFANAWGFGLDAGLQYEHDRWNFGLMGKDITSTFNAWTYNTESLQDVFAQTGNEIPQNGLEVTLPKLIGGVAYKFNLSKKITATPMVDLDFTFDGKRNVPIKSDVVSIDPKGGLELAYDDFIFLRGGVANIQTVQNIDASTSTIAQPSIGAGIKIKNVTIDYALTNFTGAAGTLYSNIFSLKLNFIRKTTPATTNTK
jgi:hypothetical protein